LSSTIELANDIDATGTTGWNGGAGFVPIGTSSSSEFSGSLEGNGHIIDGLFIDRPGTDHVGLFGHTTNAVLRNFGLTGVDITGDDNTGALVGTNVARGTSGASHLFRVFATGSVGGGDRTGGLVGSNSSSFGDAVNLIEES